MKTRIVVCVAIALISLTSCGKSKQQIETESRQREATATALAKEKSDKAKIALRKSLEDAVMGSITSGMKDPTSVQYRNVFVYSSELADVVCGEVNAKNSYGGYTGFSWFYYQSEKGQETVFMAPEDNPGKNKTREDACSTAKTLPGNLLD